MIYLKFEAMNYSILHQSHELKNWLAFKSISIFPWKLQLQQFTNSSSKAKSSKRSQWQTLKQLKNRKGRNIRKFASAVHTVSNETTNSTINGERKIWRQKFHFLKELQKYSHSSRQNEADDTCSLFTTSLYWQKFLWGCWTISWAEEHEKVGTMERRLPQAIRIDIIYKNYPSFNTISLSTCMYVRI